MICIACGHQNEEQAHLCAGCSRPLRVDDEASSFRLEEELTELEERPPEGASASGMAPGDRVGEDDGEGPGRYEVLSELGRGGMGVVFLARDRRFEDLGGVERRVVIKRILDLESSSVERFLRETRAVSSLQHENIVSIVDIGRDERGPYIVMAYVEGGTLKSRIADGPLEDDEFYELARGLGRALDFVHEHKILHRDVKPSNVLLTPAGVPKLSDFGLVRIGEVSDLSQTGHGLGTADYAAPEQKRGDKDVDVRVDVYGLGATLYYGATGTSPRTIRESRLPDRWRDLVLRCVEDDPDERFASIAEFLGALESARDSTASGLGGSVEGVTCANCEEPNRTGENYCRRCGAGLYRNCPRCETSNEVSVRYCVHCGLDVSSWMRSDEQLRLGLDHLEAHRFEAAIACGRAAEEAYGGREEVRQLLDSAGKKRTALLNAQDEAEACLDAERFEEARKRWMRVLSLDPENKRAKASLAALPALRQRRDLRSAIAEMEQALEDSDLTRALAAESRLLELAREEDAREIVRVEEGMRSLERRVDRARRAYAEAFRRDRPEDARRARNVLERHRIDPEELALLDGRLEFLAERARLRASVAERDLAAARESLRDLPALADDETRGGLALLRQEVKDLQLELLAETFADFHKALDAHDYSRAELELERVEELGGNPAELEGLDRLRSARQRALLVRRTVRFTASAAVLLVATTLAYSFAASAFNATLEQRAWGGLTRGDTALARGELERWLRSPEVFLPWVERSEVSGKEPLIERIELITSLDEQFDGAGWRTRVTLIGDPGASEDSIQSVFEVALLARIRRGLATERTRAGSDATRLRDPQLREAWTATIRAFTEVERALRDGVTERHAAEFGNLVDDLRDSEELPDPSVVFARASERGLDAADEALLSSDYPTVERWLAYARAQLEGRGAVREAELLGRAGAIELAVAARRRLELQDATLAALAAGDTGLARDNEVQLRALRGDVEFPDEADPIHWVALSDLLAVAELIDAGVGSGGHVQLRDALDRFVRAFERLAAVPREPAGSDEGDHPGLAEPGIALHYRAPLEAEIELRIERALQGTHAVRDGAVRFEGIPFDRLEWVTGDERRELVRSDNNVFAGIDLLALPAEDQPPAASAEPAESVEAPPRAPGEEVTDVAPVATTLVATVGRVSLEREVELYIDTRGPAVAAVITPPAAVLDGSSFSISVAFEELVPRERLSLSTDAGPLEVGAEEGAVRLLSLEADEFMWRAELQVRGLVGAGQIEDAVTLTVEASDETGNLTSERLDVRVRSPRFAEAEALLTFPRPGDDSAPLAWARALGLLREDLAVSEHSVSIDELAGAALDVAELGHELSGTPSFLRTVVREARTPDQAILALAAFQRELLDARDHLAGFVAGEDPSSPASRAAALHARAEQLFPECGALRSMLEDLTGASEPLSALEVAEVQKNVRALEHVEPPDALGVWLDACLALIELAQADAELPLLRASFSDGWSVHGVVDPVPTRVRCGSALGIEMVFVPSQREVASGGFYIAETEVTLQAWLAFGGAEPPGDSLNMALPVSRVAWREIDRWCRDLGLRLPSEVEWDRAASPPFWANTTMTPDASSLVVDGPYEAGQGTRGKPADRSWCGALDMRGNLMEWCADRVVNDEPVPWRVLRGGSWNSEIHSRDVSNRNTYPENQQQPHALFGFRPVLLLGR